MAYFYIGHAVYRLRYSTKNQYTEDASRQVIPTGGIQMKLYHCYQERRVGVFYIQYDYNRPLKLGRQISV